MFYFPLLQGHWPSWLPFWGGEEFLFFRPVFNIADASITTGAISLLLFNKKIFKATAASNPVTENENSSDLYHSENTDH
jgi:signal peptidase II